MKVEKISDTSIKFILTQSELVEKNIDMDKLAIEDTYTQKIIYALIKEAETKYDIYIKNNGNFKIYITNNNKGDTIITMSSFNPYDNKYKFYEQFAQQLAEKINNYPDSFSTLSMEEKVKNKLHSNFPNLPELQTPQKVSKSIMYCFNDPLSIKFALEGLDINFKDEILYKYKDKYYLILYFLKSNTGKKKIEMVFSEYATVVSQNNFDLLLQEYGELIIRQNARKIINLYY